MVKAKKKRPKKKEHRGPHHMFPQSRHGVENEENNIYPNERGWSGDYSAHHIAYHVLFANLIPQEVITALTWYMSKNGKLNQRFFAISFFVEEAMIDFTVKEVVYFQKDKSDKAAIEKRETAWTLLFGKGLWANEAIKWIKREFIDKEWLQALR